MPHSMKDEETDNKPQMITIVVRISLQEEPNNSTTYTTK